MLAFAPFKRLNFGGRETGLKGGELRVIIEYSNGASNHREPERT